MTGWTDRHRVLPEAECGTYPGYQRHMKAGDDPCQPCRRAANRYRRQHRAATTGGGDGLARL